MRFSMKGMDGARNTPVRRYAIAAAVLITACAQPRPPVVLVEPLPPPLPIEQLAVVPSQPPLDLPVAALPTGGPLITLHSSNADVRTIISQLAAAAGISLVIGPEVRGRVSVNFENVPAMEALSAVVDEAGLSLSTGPRTFATVRSYFYQPPTNVNVAGVGEIARRFNTSLKLAEAIVLSREPFRF